MKQIFVMNHRQNKNQDIEEVMSISAMKQALHLLETSWGRGDQEILNNWNETIEVLYEAIEAIEAKFKEKDG